jgi:hypothetical protein
MYKQAAKHANQYFFVQPALIIHMGELVYSIKCKHAITIYTFFNVASFEVFTAVQERILVILGCDTLSLGECPQHFKGMYCLHHHK